MHPKKDSVEFKGYSVEAYAMKGTLLNPTFLRRDVEIDSAVFHYWKLNKLLPTIPDGKRSELSVVDIIWLETLKTLKSYDCSLKVMKAVCKVLFEDSYYKNHAEQNLKRYLEYLEIEESVRTLDNEEIQIKNILINTLHNPYHLWYFRWSISHLYTLVLDYLENQTEILIIIYPNQAVKISGHTIKLDIADEINIAPSKSYIQISLSEIIDKFFSSVKMEENIINYELLTEDEIKVIKAMREDKVKRLTVHFNDKDGKVSKIESDEAGMISGEKAMQIKKLLGLNNYSSIELKTRDGQNLSFIKSQKNYIK